MAAKTLTRFLPSEITDSLGDPQSDRIMFGHRPCQDKVDEVNLILWELSIREAYYKAVCHALTGNDNFFHEMKRNGHEKNRRLHSHDDDQLLV